MLFRRKSKKDRVVATAGRMVPSRRAMVTSAGVAGGLALLTAASSGGRVSGRSSREASPGRRAGAGRRPGRRHGHRRAVSARLLGMRLLELEAARRRRDTRGATGDGDALGVPRRPRRPSAGRTDGAAGMARPEPRQPARRGLVRADDALHPPPRPSTRARHGATQRG